MAGWFAGHRRAVLVAGGVGFVGVAALAALYVSRNQPPPPPPSHTQGAQAPSGLPGGRMETEEGARLREQDAQFKAAQAMRQSVSFTAPMAGHQPFEAGRTGRPPRQVQADEGQRRPQKPEKPGPVDEKFASAQALDLRGLIEGWNGGRMDFQLVLARDAMQPKPEQRAAGSGSAERESTAGRSKRVLLPGNTGVYGVVRVGANSDVPGAPIVVELRNPGGPVDGLRASCAYASQSTNRNGGPVAGGIVKCSSLTLADGRNVKISAVLIGPDDMNTVVATRIDDHFDERILYPMAAGFMRGLGQALLLSGSTIAGGPFGVSQSYGNIGWERAVGVGLGAGAAAAGRVVEQSAPRGPTYYMDGGGQVGVWFQEPVEVED